MDCKHIYFWAHSLAIRIGHMDCSCFQRRRATLPFLFHLRSQGQAKDDKSGLPHIQSIHIPLGKYNQFVLYRTELLLLSYEMIRNKVWLELKRIFTFFIFGYGRYTVIKMPNVVRRAIEYTFNTISRPSVVTYADSVFAISTLRTLIALWGLFGRLSC